MRPLFIDSKPSGVRSRFWGLLALVVLSGAALLFWQRASWPDWVRSLPSAWAQPEPEVQAPATEAVPLPAVAEASAEPAGAASASMALAEASAPPGPADDIDQQVLAFVERWAASWSAKQLDSYFAAYAEQFQPEGKKTLADWAQERKQRIASKSKITVQIKDFMIVSSDHSGLKTSFTQVYEADGFRSISPKVLLLNKQEGAWKIVREYTP